MAKKPFEIQSADLIIGGVNLQAGTTGVVIPGVTQATNYFVEEVDDIDGANPDTFGSDANAVSIIDNAEYLYRSGTQTPSNLFSAAAYNVEELDDGEIEEISVVEGLEGTFLSADKTFAEAGNMWATTVSNALDNFSAGDWTQIPFRPRIRAGEVENLSGGGNGESIQNGVNSLSLDDNGNAVFQGDGSGDGVNRGLEWDYGNSTGGVNSRVRQDNDGLTVRAYTEDDEEEGLYAAPVNIVTNQGVNEKWWRFAGDGGLTFPDGSLQTTAYTGESGGVTTTSELWIAAGANPAGAGILSSTNGTTWTPQDYEMSDLEINRVAIGANMIVYLMRNTNSSGGAIYYTSAPETTPTMATGTDVYGDGSIVTWEEINYLGGKFVAVGSYESNGNTVSATINSIALADVGRTYPRITLGNIDYNFDNVSITITGATNTELNGTFLLQYNSLDTYRTGVYDLILDDGFGNLSAPTITSTDVTGAAMNDLTNVNGSLPIFAYSTNGIFWTYGNIDPTYFMFVGGPVSELEMSDVAYNGTGYLIPVLANTFGNDDVPTAYGPGAFYITDLTAVVGEAEFIPGGGPNSLQGNFNNIAAYADGTFFVCDDDFTVWTGNYTDGWTSHDIRSDFSAAYGWQLGVGENNDGDIDSAVAGTVGGTEFWVGTTNAGMVVSTSNQGSTFQFSIPDPYTAPVTVSQANQVVLDFTDVRQPQLWEKITVTVANGDDTRWNGVYYTYPAGSNLFELYDDVEGNAIDGSAWTMPSNPLTVTFSYGRDLDAIHIADDVCIVYSNNSNKLYRSTDLINWTVVSNEGDYQVNDIYYSSSIALSSNQLTNGDATLTLNSNGSVTFPDGTVQTTAYTAVAPEPYKGFKAHYGRMYQDEPTISKLVIYQDTNDSITSVVDPDTDDDLFRVMGLDNSGIIALINIYGVSTTTPVPLSDLKRFAEAIVDNVILNNGQEGNFNSTENMRQAFYNNFGNFSSLAGERYVNFDFYKREWRPVSGTTQQGSGAVFDVVANDGDPGVYTATVTNGGSNYLVGHKIKILGSALGGTDVTNDLILTVTAIDPAVTVSVSGTADGGALTPYTGVTGTNYNVGSGATFVLSRNNASSTVNWGGYIDAGSNYVVGDVITVLGTSVNGATPANDITVTVTSVQSAGALENATVSGTLPTDVGPTNNIDDGGDDQYDNANYIFTNLQGDSREANGDVDDGDWALPYNLNTVTTGTAFFGVGSEYVVTYNDSIFGLFVSNASINWVGTNGNSGFDGDGIADTGSLYEANILGNFTFSENTVTNSSGMLLDTARGTLALGTNMEAPGDPAHFHIAFDGSNSYPSSNDLFLGDDYNYVKIGAYASGVEIGTNSRGDGTVEHTWAFNNDGTVKLPTLTVPISDNANPSGTGQTLKFSDPTQQAIIYGPLSNGDYINAQRVIIQGAPGYTGTTGEGGDIYLWAGPGGDAGGDGGDIKIRAGRGQLSGGGGYLNFQAGESGTGSGGWINIESGYSSTYGSGGDITVQARGGGQITLRTTNSEGNSRDLVLNNAGTLTLPGAVVKSTVTKTGAVVDTGAATVLVDSTWSVSLVDGNYGPFTLGVVTFTVEVTGGVAVYTVTATTGDSTVGEVIGALNAEDLGGTPGTISPIIVTVVNQNRTAIDLTKTTNILEEGLYTLENGVDGQIMYFVPASGNTNETYIRIANARILDGGTFVPTEQADYNWEVFVGTVVGPYTISMAIFADGAWCLRGGANA